MLIGVEMLHQSLMSRLFLLLLHISVSLRLLNILHFSIVRIFLFELIITSLSAFSSTNKSRIVSHNQELGRKEVVAINKAI